MVTGLAVAIPSPAVAPQVSGFGMLATGAYKTPDMPLEQNDLPGERSREELDRQRDELLE